MGLTVKQQKFIDEYIISGNATEAAIKAGYAKRSARAMGYENLTKPYIAAAIEKRLAELESQAIAKQDEVLKYLTSVLRGESRSEVIAYTDGIPERFRKGPDEKDRLRAAELLGKRYALFTDTLDLNANAAVVIIDDVADSD